MMPRKIIVSATRPIGWLWIVLPVIFIFACQPAATPTSISTPTPTIYLTPTIKVELPEPFDFPSPNGRQLGNSDAAVTVEVFSDFQCPACKRYATTVEHKIIEQYIPGGKVLYIYHHFPFIGQESMQAANASMCAGEQEKFWEYHDILFANQGGENQGAFSNQKLAAYAGAAGLDTNAFSVCLAENRYQTDINQDLTLGKNRDISAVPSVFVNGIAITPGKMPGVKDLQKAIDAALAQP